MTQLALTYSAPSPVAAAEPDDSLDARFAEFHDDNPSVYEELRCMALAAVRAGRKRLGIGQLWEVLRWNRSMQTTEDAPSLNNDYRSRYARLLMHREPTLRGVFETRSLASEDER
jgi:hypothetical protein